MLNLAYKKGLIILFNKFKSIKKRIQIYRFVSFPLGKKVYIIGTPEHGNTGDHAIAIAEKKFLVSNGYSAPRIKEISCTEYFDYAHLYKRYIRRNSLICGMGGGNLGDLWIEGEFFRYKLISDFPDNPMLIFPQTIYFTNTDSGRKLLETSKEYYNGKKGLTIVAREQTSFDLLKEYFKVPRHLLVPDMVLYTSLKDYGVIKQTDRDSYVLLVFRQDKEKVLDDAEKEIIIKQLEEKKIEYKTGDTICNKQVNKSNREAIIKEEIQEFANAKLVITDRLHGMIFSTISATPCIVLGNNHHKIKDSYAWISYLPYVEFANSIAEVEELIPKLLRLKDCRFDNTPLLEYYNKLFEAVQGT